MEAYERLYESYDPAQLNLLKSRLGEADIDYRVQFEHTLILTGVFGLGNQGAVIEVRPSQWAEAAQLLLEFGIRVDYDSKRDQLRIVRHFDDLSQRIPLFGALDLSTRLVVAGGLLLTLIFFVVLFGFIEGAPRF